MWNERIDGAEQYKMTNGKVFLVSIDDDTERKSLPMMQQITSCVSH